MSNQDDPWASRVAAIFGEEVPQAETAPVPPKPSTAAGLVDMLRNVDSSVYDSPVVSRYDQIRGRVRRRLEKLETPLFIESSYVSEPAYGSMPYVTSELITKEGGLPREVRYNGRVYVNAAASLALLGEELISLSRLPRLDIDDKRDVYRPIVGNWPSQISVGGEAYTLYREGQYDVLGLCIDGPDIVGESFLRIASVCSLCNKVMFSNFRLTLLREDVSDLEIIKEYLAEVKEADCPNCVKMVL